MKFYEVQYLNSENQLMEVELLLPAGKALEAINTFCDSQGYTLVSFECSGSVI